MGGDSDEPFIDGELETPVDSPTAPPEPLPVKTLEESLERGRSSPLHVEFSVIEVAGGILGKCLRQAFQADHLACKRSASLLHTAHNIQMCVGFASRDIADMLSPH